MKKILITIMMIGALFTQTVSNFTFDLVDINELGLNDLDIFGTGNVKNLINASLDYDFAGAPMSIKLEITRNGQEILNGVTDKIEGVGSGHIELTSTNFNSGVEVQLQAGGTGLLKIKNYTFNNGVLTAGELALGALPNGHYVFTLTIRSNGIPVANGTMIDFLDINNDWQVDLNAPADWEIINNRPFFQWTTNTELFSALTLYVWEINSPGATDDEISSQPPVYEVDVTNNTDHQYQPTAPQLINGKSYAWTVKGTIKKVSGDVQLSNVINKFTFQTAGNAASTARILGILRSILQSNYDGVMKEFKGYNPTGVLKLNGTATTAQDLSALISAIQSGQKKIQVETN